jgi:hypothetical protein
MRVSRKRCPSSAKNVARGCLGAGRPRELLSGTTNARFRDAWAMAQAESFAPADPAVSPLLPQAAA